MAVGLGRDAISTTHAEYLSCVAGSSLLGNLGECHSHPVRIAARSANPVIMLRLMLGYLFHSLRERIGASIAHSAIRRGSERGGDSAAESRHPSERPMAIGRMGDAMRGESAR